MMLQCMSFIYGAYACFVLIIALTDIFRPFADAVRAGAGAIMVSLFPIRTLLVIESSELLGTYICYQILPEE